MTPYTFYNTSILRTPSKNINELENINPTEESILKYFEKIKLSIYFSSPNLYNSIINYKDLDYKKKESTLQSLYKYIIRMCTRPTPYGLFSGLFTICMDKNDESNSLFLSNLNSLTMDLNKFVFYDYNFLSFVYNRLIEKHYRDTLYFGLNNTIQIDSKANILSILTQEKNNKQLDYQIKEFNITQSISYIIRKFKGKNINRALFFSELRSMKINEDEIDDFFNLLIDNSIFYSKSSYIQSNDHFFKEILNITQGRDNFINKIDNHLKKINTDLNLNEIISFDEWIKKEIEYTGQVYKLDLISLKKEEFKIGIPKSIQKSLLENVEIVNTLLQSNINTRLVNFKEKFIKKYQYKFIPILEALNPFYGINYDETICLNQAPLIDDIPFSLKTDAISINNDLLSNLLSNNKNEILNIKKDAFLSTEKLKIKNFHIQYRIIDEDSNLILVESIGDALSVFSRFKYGDNKLQDLSKQIKNSEKDDDHKIYAEIIHTPDRLEAMNILDNINLTKYSIPIITNSKSKKNIYLDDLLLGVQDGQFKLYSKSHKKQVIPHFSTMAIPNNISKLPIFLFLSELSNELKYNKQFPLQKYISSLNNFIPRIQYKNIIFCPKTWFISINDVDKEDISKLKKVFEKKNIPSKIILKDSDNELFIDTNNPLSMSILYNEILKRKSVIIQEYLFYNKENYQLISFLKNNNINDIDPLINIEKNNKIKRLYLPFDEWVYIKLYCNEYRSDDVIINDIPEIIKYFEKKFIIEKFFFIRFVDHEGFHIRLRINIKKTEESINILDKISKHVKDKSNFIEKISLDSYEREIERYGLNIDKIEYLFYLDSKFTINFLKKISNKLVDVEKNRILICLYSIDYLLNLIYTREEKTHIIESLKNDFVKEFLVDKNILKFLNKKYKDYFNDINSFFFKNDFSEELKYYNTLDNLKFLKDEKILVIKSLIHMNINRYFVTEQRKHELIIYFILSRYYNYINNKV